MNLQKTFVQELACNEPVSIKFLSEDEIIIWQAIHFSKVNKAFLLKLSLIRL